MIHRSKRKSMALPLVCALALSCTTSVNETGDLVDLAERYWESHLRANPVAATILGDHRYDHILSDNSEASIRQRREELLTLQKQVSSLTLESLGGEDRVTKRQLLEVIDSDLRQLNCHFEEWVVDPLRGPQIAFQNLPSIQTARTPEAGRAMVQRWLAMGPYLRHHIDNLRRGLDDQRFATHSQVERVHQQLEELLAKPLDEWSLLQPLENDLGGEFESALTAAVRDVIRPALVEYRDFLQGEVLPKARPETEVGIASLPGGDECYRNMIRFHTSLDISPEEIHEIGQNECRRIMYEMRGLGQKVLGAESLEETLEKLRSDPSLYFTSRDAVEDKAREALARARSAMPNYFGILPQAPCVVVRMEPHEEKHSTIAYYRQPALDGSRPGTYYINTYAPETRPRYEAEALAFHEAIPGHHLQIAISQELQGIPEFRKHLGSTAFVEGWALYTERLSDEMGLYSGDLDRIGMLSYEAWRACRLVVDTGMHALGWSRQQAIDFMLANSALAENNIINEVDRYITWPAQALAYKLGQLEILELRQQAKDQQGTSFDIREFHDVVLRNGAVTLKTLRSLVEEHYGM